MIGRGRARCVLVGFIGVCALLTSCASSPSAQASGGAASPTSAAKRFFAALLKDDRNAATTFRCGSGWSGPRSFSFASYSDFPGHPEQILSQVQPTAHKASDGWTVHLGNGLGLPDFRVIAQSGRYYVCGFRPHH